MYVDYNRVKKWAGMGEAPRNEALALSFDKDSTCQYETQAAFWPIASPIYQSRLLRKLVALPTSKSESGGYQESSSLNQQAVEVPGDIFRTQGRPGLQGYRAPSVTASEYARRAQLEQTQGERIHKGRRPKSPIAVAPPRTRSEEYSFRSFSATGRESAKLSQQNLREDVVREARRSSPRALSRAPVRDDLSDFSLGDVRRDARRVSFARL